MISILGGLDAAKDPLLNSQTCINFMPEAKGTPSTKQKDSFFDTDQVKGIITPTEGSAQVFFTGTVGEVRKMIKVGSTIYGVTGNNVWKRTTDNIVTQLGSISGVTSTNICLSTNQTSILITNESSQGWYIDLTNNSLNVITDPDFVGGKYSTYNCGYFLVLQPTVATGQYKEIFASDLNNVTSWNPLSFGTAVGKGEQSNCLFGLNRNVYIFTDNSLERLYVAGGTPFPWSFDTGFLMEKGTPSPESVVAADNTLFYVSQTQSGTGLVVRLDQSVQVISSPSISQKLAKWGDLSKVKALSIALGGHEYYVLTHPTANQTFVYDTSTLYWHQRSSLGLGRWYPSSALAFQGQIFLGHCNNGWVSNLSSDILTENGNNIIRERTTETYRMDTQQFLNQLSIVGKTGISPTGKNSLIELMVSKDGGNTFKSFGQKSLGVDGAYKMSVIYRKLGKSDTWVFKFIVSDAVKTSLLGINPVYTKGMK